MKETNPINTKLKQSNPQTAEPVPSMENRLLQNLQTLIPSLSDPTFHLHLQTLALARSLLVTPNSSPHTLTSVIDSLIKTLNLHRNDPVLVRHIVKILGDAASLTSHAIPAVRSVLDAGDRRTSAAALAILDGHALDQETILSLISSPSASARAWAVDSLVECPSMSPESAVKVLLVLSGDIYPSVRRAAADGMVKLLKKDRVSGDELMVKCCYDCAVELIGDEDELVRSAAVRLISQCGHLFAAVEAKMDSIELMDIGFIQLCSMARDMSLKVRIEVFTALGRARRVSESVLLQSLSKKILGSSNGKNSLAEFPIKESRFSIVRAAGAFVHGIEDEFHEVRAAACKSMGVLAMYSIQFAGGALNLLMDMLNNDSEAVRLQTLQTLFHMAISDRLVVLQEHMHMFLGLLADISPFIRRATREVLRLMKLPKMEIFISAVDGLTTNLMTYPEVADIIAWYHFRGDQWCHVDIVKKGSLFQQTTQEEEDIFCALFFIGKKHGKFSVKRVKAFKLEIASSSEGELSLDSPPMAVLLVLSISSSFSDEQCMKEVPASIFAQAIPLFGRISRSLGVMDCDLLLAYLFYRSGTAFPAKEIKPKEVELLQRIVVEVISNYKKRTDLICNSSWPVQIEISETNCKEDLSDLNEASISLEHSKQEMECLAEDVTQSINLILKVLKGIWPLRQSHCTHKVQRMLRACKEDLDMIAWSAERHFTAILAFTSYYIQVMQLFTEIWEQLQIRKFHLVGMISVDLLLDKLETCLKRMKYSFAGLSREEECHILELNLLSYVLRMCQDGICSDLMLQKLLAIISQLELLYEDRSSELSSFVKELRKACIRKRGESPQLSPLPKLIQLFCLDKFPLSGRFRYIYAELSSIGHDSENCLPFIPGLPIGITFQITLYNVSNECVLWLRMAVGQSIQYAFLDLCLSEGSDEVKKCTVNVPYYATPKAATFQLKVSVCMECPLEDLMLCRKVQRGPKFDVVKLCEECDIYFVRME